MSIKPRRQVLARSDNRVIMHAALFLICAMLSALGMGASALWCFLPAALVLEGLSLLSPQRNSRRI